MKLFLPCLLNCFVHLYQRLYKIISSASTKKEGFFDFCLQWQAMTSKKKISYKHAHIKWTWFTLCDWEANVCFLTLIYQQERRRELLWMCIWWMVLNWKEIICHKKINGEWGIAERYGVRVTVSHLECQAAKAHYVPCVQEMWRHGRRKRNTSCTAYSWLSKPASISDIVL